MREKEFNFKFMKYFNELKRAMNYLAANEKTVFVGQAVEVPGTAMFNTLEGINPKKLIELPVAEEMQMGMSLGMGLNNMIPVSIFPRWNFVLLAINQLVNHIDKVDVMSNGGYSPKIIIRTGIGSEHPLHPQYQHVGDFTEAIQKMCTTIEVIRLEEPEDIFPAYEEALLGDDFHATLLIENGSFYNDK